MCRVNGRNAGYLETSVEAARHKWNHCPILCKACSHETQNFAARHKIWLRDKKIGCAIQNLAALQNIWLRDKKFGCA
jgi:hypothetical protein